MSSPRICFRRVLGGRRCRRTWSYPTRSAIERIISWTATQNGHRVKLRYIGTAKNDAWLHTRCAALNLRTLFKAGLTRCDGAWALA